MWLNGSSAFPRPWLRICCNVLQGPGQSLRESSNFGMHFVHFLLPSSSIF